MAENVYFECRKRAAAFNDKLRSRAVAAELLGVSESTLTHYELGVVKNVPVDVVVLMADLYQAPELKRYYCKRECPIGCDFPVAEKAGTLEGAVIRLLSSLDEDTIRNAVQKLVGMAADGEVTSGEAGDFGEALAVLDNVIAAVSELRIFSEKTDLKERSEGE